MAKLLGVKEREEALKKTNELINTLKATNIFLNTENPNKIYEISFEVPSKEDPAELEAEGKKKNKKSKAHIVSASALTENKGEIERFVHTYKQHVINEILGLSEKYEIDFDDYEKELLGIENN